MGLGPKLSRKVPRREHGNFLVESKKILMLPILHKSWYTVGVMQNLLCQKMITLWSLNIWRVRKEVKVLGVKVERQQSGHTQTAADRMTAEQSEVKHKQPNRTTSSSWKRSTAWSAIFVFCWATLCVMSSNGKKIQPMPNEEESISQNQYIEGLWCASWHNSIAFESWVLQYFNTYWPISVPRIWTFHQVLLCRTYCWLRARPYVNFWQSLHDCLKI